VNSAPPDRALPPAWFERLAAVMNPRLDPPVREDVISADIALARRSAVLMLFGPGDTARGPEILLTERSRHLRAHAGQVAFPGGRVDPHDAGPEAAAVREAQEEAGVDPAGVEIRGTGPDLHLRVTDFLVTPVLAWWHTPSPVTAGDPAEVSRVVGVPVADLVDPDNRFQVDNRRGFVSPAFAANGLFVWGFTAIVLNWLIQLAELEQPWDLNRRRPIPDYMLGPGIASSLRETLQNMDVSEQVSE
jgi:8-oxo-dGTP pyrophosphatase MutT (NUDIX family)